MSDAIQYCKNCTSQVMCHMERKCMRQAIGLSSAACSAPLTKRQLRRAAKIYQLAQVAFADVTGDNDAELMVSQMAAEDAWRRLEKMGVCIGNVGSLKGCISESQNVEVSDER